MTIFTEISLIIVLATVIAGIMRVLKQPLIMGHIFTGIIVGPLVLNLIHHSETIEIFSELGISILLFIVGIHLSPKVIKEVGKVALIAGLGQIGLTWGISFALARLFGYSNVSAIYIGAGMTFSSTIIVLKLLSDKHDIEKLYGKIVVGILLVQDLVAILALIVISASAEGGGAVSLIFLLLVKGILATMFLLWVSLKILPKLGDFFAKSPEFLFLFAIGWGFGLATFFDYIGFSIEIGALMAGVTLSVSPYSHEIGSKLKPLRDFFIIMFFILLGSKMSVSNLSSLLTQVAVFTIFVVLLKPIIIILLTGIMGYRRKTSFFTGVSLAQVSEFSLILVLLGLKVGQLENSAATLVTIIALITIAISTYLIMYDEKLYLLLGPYLKPFERKRTKKEVAYIGDYEVILFGAHRVGYDFIKLFRKLGQSFLVLDFNPEIVSELVHEGINARYGDAEDVELLDEIPLEKAKLVISTIPDNDTNEFLIKRIRTLNDSVIIICISHDIDESLDLYHQGATYVILPHFIGGHFAAMLAAEHWLNMDRFTIEREKHIKYLEERKRIGHTHPEHEF